MLNKGHCYYREIRFRHKANWGDSYQWEETSTGIWNISMYIYYKHHKEKKNEMLYVVSVAT